jgi:hypothetical protein
MKLPRALLLYALLPLGACKAPGPEVWSDGRVRVLATVTRELDRRYAEYRLEVGDENTRFCFGSSAFGSPRERRASFAAVQSLDGFLFVPANCGGGNASKCRGFEVFITHPRLTWLGNITGRYDGASIVPYADGSFFDTGDMLEINDLLSHAESPRYVMAYRFREGRLVFDAPQTWHLNAEGYAAALDDAPGLLFKAGLAKLCGRQAELQAVQATAERKLNAEGKRRFHSSLKKVPTRDVRPNPFIPVGECPSDAKP